MLAITRKESHIWELRFKGFSGSEIARKLDITRQAISKALKNVDTKILRTLSDNARMMGLAVTSVDTEKGCFWVIIPRPKQKQWSSTCQKAGYSRGSSTRESVRAA